MMRRLSRSLSILLSAALLLSAPGAGPYGAFAQVLESGAVSARVLPSPGSAPQPLPGVPAALGQAPVSLLGSLVLPPPAASVAAAVEGQSAPLSAKAEAIGKDIEALQGPDAVSDPEGSSELATQAFETLIGGLAPAALPVELDVLEEWPYVGAGYFLGRWHGAIPFEAGTGPGAVPAPASPPATQFPIAGGDARSPDSTAPERRGIERLPYGAKRSLLAAIYAASGVLYSLPVASPAAEARALEEASHKRFVFMDVDDTLTSHNQRLSPEMVEAVRGVLRAGKTPVFITDRPDFNPGESAFASLEALPVEVRTGLFVGTNAGGRVYRYDDQGVPQLVFEKPPMEEALKGRITQAAEAVKARLTKLGVALHDGSQGIPPESYKPHSYAMILAVGTPASGVRAAARELQKELASRGIGFEVMPRLAKDKTKPPYVVMNLVDKSVAAGEIARRLGADAGNTVILGDSFFMPRPAAPRGRLGARLARLGRRLSGQDIPETGNETDRNMEKALPGALTIAVGGTADPRMTNAYVLPGRWQVESPRVLKRVASRQAPDPEAPTAAGVLTTLGAYALGAALIAGVILGEAWLLSKFLEGVLTAPAPYDPNVPPGMPRDLGELFGLGSLLGGLAVVGLAGLGSVLSPRDYLRNPDELFARALKEAREAAARAGIAGELSFLSAAASLPLRDGRHWKFSFVAPGAPGTRDIVYVDFQRLPGSTSGDFDSRASAFKGVAESVALQGGLPLTADPYLFKRGDAVSPETALGIVQRELKGEAARVSVSLALREEPVSGDKDLWYRFHADDGSISEVNARTGGARWVKAPPPAASRPSEKDGFERFWESWWGPPVFFGGLMSMLSAAVAGLSFRIVFVPFATFTGFALALVGALFYALGGFRGGGGLPRGFLFGGLLTMLAGWLVGHFFGL